MKISKTLLSLACLLIFISAGLNIYFFKKVIKLSESTTPLAVRQEKPADAVEKTAQPGPVPEKSYIRELEYQLDATEEELDMVSNRLAEELDKKESRNNLLSLPPSYEKTMMESVDRDYSLIYGPLDLSPEDLKKFKDIVAAWRIANGKRVAIWNVSSTAEDREAVEKLRQEIREKYEGEFIKLMGEEKFKIYDDFKNSSSEHFLLSTFMKTLSPDDKIGDAEAYTLIDTMYRARKAVEDEMASVDGNDKSLDSNKFDYTREMEKKVIFYREYKEIVDDAPLSPGQAAQFKAYLSKELERHESQLKIISERNTGRDTL